MHLNQMIWSDLFEASLKSFVGNHVANFDFNFSETSLKPFGFSICFFFQNFVTFWHGLWHPPAQSPSFSVSSPEMVTWIPSFSVFHIITLHCPVDAPGVQLSGNIMHDRDFPHASNWLESTMARASTMARVAKYLNIFRKWNSRCECGIFS